MTDRNDDNRFWSKPPGECLLNGVVFGLTQLTFVFFLFNLNQTNILRWYDLKLIMDEQNKYFNMFSIILEFFFYD